MRGPWIQPCDFAAAMHPAVASGQKHLRNRVQKSYCTTCELVLIRELGLWKSLNLKTDLLEAFQSNWVIDYQRESTITQVQLLFVGHQTPWPSQDGSSVESQLRNRSLGCWWKSMAGHSKAYCSQLDDHPKISQDYTLTLSIALHFWVFLEDTLFLLLFWCETATTEGCTNGMHPEPTVAWLP